MSHKKIAAGKKSSKKEIEPRDLKRVAGGKKATRKTTKKTT
ncbi:MAG: hypothetical protein ACYS0D_03290 [Planctomycetota bacterium]|jgi:hypothetical protein